MDKRFGIRSSDRAEVYHRYQPRVRAGVTKGARGAYRWTVEVVAASVPLVKSQLFALEDALAAKYGEVEGGEGEGG